MVVLAPTLGRDLVAAMEVRAVDDARDAGVIPSCFVGDFVGDLRYIVSACSTLYSVANIILSMFAVLDWPRSRSVSSLLGPRRWAF